MIIAKSVAKELSLPFRVLIRIQNDIPYRQMESRTAGRTTFSASASMTDPSDRKGKVPVRELVILLP
jgi:hypothetical protein